MRRLLRVAFLLALVVGLSAALFDATGLLARAQDGKTFAPGYVGANLQVNGVSYLGTGASGVNFGPDGQGDPGAVFIYDPINNFSDEMFGNKESGNYAGATRLFGYVDGSGVWHSYYAFGAEINDTTDATSSDFYIVPFHNSAGGQLYVYGQGHVTQSLPNAAPAASEYPGNGSGSIYVNESTKTVFLAYKDSGGTVRTATLGTWP